MSEHSGQAPRWMSVVLWLAGTYNLTWGGLVLLFPGPTYHWGGLERPGHPLVAAYRPLWECIGMIVGVYGVGYLAAARAPLRHWPIVLVGLLGKVLGPVGALDAVLRADLPWTTFWTNLTNDLIWWVPFGLILYRAYRATLEEEPFTGELAQALERVRSQDGVSLGFLSRTGPVLVVFLRHFG